nr:hypothetical protein [Tanacetum cinerariifolium]
MRGTVQNKVDRETRFNNEFDQFVAEPKEALVSYVTQVCLAKRLTKDSYDDLFDYLSQYEKLVNASRAKKLEKSHDPLPLVAHTGSSFRIPSPYYVTHPSLVVDYDDGYQGDACQNNSEDPLTSAIMLLARAIIQRFSSTTNNCLRTSSNTKNQAIMQANRVNIQSRNSGLSYDSAILSKGDMLLLETFLNDDHSSDFKTKSSSTSLNSLLEETNNFNNSLPEFTTFSKIDSLLDEFAGELALLKSIPPGIDETDCDFKEVFTSTEEFTTIFTIS